MNMLIKSLAIVALVSASGLALAKQASVKITSPIDGETVTSPFKVQMSADNIKVRPAGEAVDEKTSGHHHILVNQTAIPEGQVIPADEKHLHFGKAQTEAELKLAPGDYTLTLQFADGAHRSYGEKLAHSIKVHVK